MSKNEYAPEAVPAVLVLDEVGNVIDSGDYFSGAYDERKRKAAEPLTKLSLGEFVIDFQSFAEGKVLKAVSENRAEWVYP